MFLALAVASCSFPRLIAENSIAYNSTLEEHNNQELVVNILRARDDAPLSFTDLSQIRGSIQTSASLQSFSPIGPLHGSTTRKTEQATLSIQMNPTFDIVPLNATIFTNAISQPVSRSVIAQLQESHYIPDRVILNLFIESIERIDANGIRVFVNAPCSPTALECYRQFQLFLRELSSLTTAGSIPSMSNLVPRVVFRRYQELSPIGLPNEMLPIKDIPSNASIKTKVVNGKIQAYEVTDRVAICRNIQRFLSDDSVLVVRSDGLDTDEERCAKSQVENTGSPRQPNYTFKIRSLRRMFDYLGHLLLIPAEERPIEFDIAEKPHPENWIITSYRNDPYYVAGITNGSYPSTSSETLHIFQILTQLLNASRSASEIATTKAVQSVP